MGEKSCALSMEKGEEGTLGVRGEGGALDVGVTLW
jgi:hypothetical protein